jgi:heme/copper-type cytochrome/quinol oxidase subunit 2
MGSSSLLRGAGVVALAIALMECGYRVAFWYWMSISDPANAAAYASHLHTWITAAVIVGLTWMYLGWKLLMEDRAASKSNKAAKAKKTQV